MQEKNISDPNPTSDPKIFAQRGKDFIEAGDLVSANDCFTKGLVYDPLNSDMRYWRGRKLIGFSKYAESAADLRLSAVLDPENWEKWYYGGVAAYLAGMYDATLESMTKAREMIIKHGQQRHLPAAVDWYWMTAIRLGKREDALRVCGLLSKDMEAEDGDYLCRVLLYRGDLSPDNFVENCMEQIPESNKDREGIYEVMLKYGLANYLRWSGDLDKAVPLLESVARSTVNPHLFAIKQAVMDLEELG